MQEIKTKQPDPELKNVSDQIQQLLKAGGFEVYLPSFLQDAQSKGYRLFAFGVKDPGDITADYEVDVWAGNQIFLKSIWPQANRIFETKISRMLAERGYTNVRIASYTH